MSSNHLEGLVGSDAKWDSIVFQGLLVKLSTREFTVLISIFTVAFAFLVARLFRVFSLLTFRMVIRERPNEHQMDQLRVAVVNFRTPFHVVGESITWRVIFRGRERERKFALAWLTGAIGFLLLGLSLPVLLSQFPVSNGFAGGSSCSFGLAVVDKETPRPRSIFDAYLRYEQQNALSHTDADGCNYAAFSAESVGCLRPNDTIKKLPSCPTHAAKTACADGDALNFFGEYWLTPSDLGVGNIPNMKFGVATQCYKIIDKTQELAPPPNITWPFRVFGLLYGPIEGLADFVYPNLTERIIREEAHGRGYNVHSYSVLQEDSSIPGDQSPWTPREDLHHDGDISLLIYHLGATYALEFGEDPLFQTVPLNKSSSAGSNWVDDNPEHIVSWRGYDLFKPATQTVSVLCNTTYKLYDAKFIGKESGHYVELGGYKKLRAFVENIKNDTIRVADPPRLGFLELLADIAHFSGIEVSSAAPSGVLANNLLLSDVIQQFDFKIQRFLDEISGQKELTRLFLSTRTRFILAARRAVLNEWMVPFLQLGFHLDEVVLSSENENLTATCRATLIPDSDFKTTTARPWAIAACVWFVTVLLTYSAPVIRKFGWGLADEIERKWMLRKAGSLYNQLTRDQSVASEVGPKQFEPGNGGLNTSSLLEGERNTQSFGPG